MACGGGGGGDGGATTPANAAPVARAGSGQNVVVGTLVALDGTGSSDPDNDPLSFAWSLVSAPAGSTAALTAATTARPSFTTDREGSYALSLVVSDGKASSAPASVTVTATPSATLQITVDKPEPLSGTVQLSLNRSLSSNVTWFADLQTIGSGPGVSGSSVPWNTLSVPNGTRLITARIATSPNAFTEVRRSLTVANLRIETRVSGEVDPISVDTRALPGYRITRVSAVFDGRDAGTLTSPNTCWECASGVTNAYRFILDTRNKASGNYPMVITASDDSGASTTTTLTIRVANPPRLTLASPGEGSFAHGTLRTRGTASSVTPGPITVTARLGDLKFLDAPGGDFSGSYDLTGVTPGPYLLTVRATDSAGVYAEVQRRVIIASSASLSHVPVFQLPPEAVLLDAEGDRLLYTTPDRSVRLRNLASGAEATLAGSSALSSQANWQLENGRSYVSAQGSDCARACIYEWGTDGQRRNLSALDPSYSSSSGASYALYPVVRGDKLIWVNWLGPSPTGNYTLFDRLTGQYTRISAPAGASYVGNTNYDFTTAGGPVRFFYWAQTGGEGMSSIFELYRWNSDTGVSTQLTQGGIRNVYPATDGERVAWEQSPIGGSPDNLFTLMTAPLVSGSGAAIATRVGQWSLRDGVLAWSEGLGAVRVVRASTGGVISQVSSQPSPILHGNSNGRVVYSAQDKTYSWNSTTRSSSLRADTGPDNQTALIANGYLIFAVGPSLYRIPLD